MDEFIIIVILIVIVGIFSAGITWSNTEDKWEKRCVKEGVAEYYLDANHEKQFRFIKKP